MKTATKTQKLLFRFRNIGMLSMLMSVFLFADIAKAQLVYNESFNTTVNTNSLALGWAQGKFGAGTDPDNFWDRRTTGLYPVMAPHTGSGMMRYYSYLTTAGEASFLASKRLDMRALPPGGTTFSFWMYRDNGWTGYNDRIQVYLNSTPDMSGTPVLLTETVTLSNVLNRHCALAPAAGICNGWNQYFYAIPQAGNNTANVYVIFLAISAFGNDMHIDDFSITTYPNAQTYTSFAGSVGVTFQNTTTTGINQQNQMIIGCKLVMSGALTPRTLTSMQFNTNGSTNPPTDIANAKLWFSGGTPTFDLTNAILMGTYTNPHFTNDTFLVANWANYAAPSLTSFSGLEHGDNYFWITYDIPIGATSGNFVDAEWINLNISGYGNIAPNPQTLVGNRLIDIVYCIPAYAVGTSWANYQTNDFVNSVNFVGDNLPAPGVVNNQNLINAYAGPLCPSPFPRFCPFQSHPPDYEKFAEVPGKTTTVTANGTTNYPISMQVGTYGGGNCIAAWIDYNKDGQFNNWFSQITINATGAAGTNTINLTGVGEHPGWVVGMAVSGTGIAPGATITAVAFATVTLSANNVGAVSGGILFTHPTGEKISQSQYLGALGTYTTTFRVPNTATSGKTRLRVREVWIDYNIDPCAYAWYGETEDYTITIIPDCPGYPGYTTWLGLTDNWQDPSNWCPAIAPISPNPFVNVRIPGGPSGAYTYNRPVIRSNVIARASKLRIETGDTIYIDAQTNSSLTVQDSMKIWTPTSALKINTTFEDSAQVFNGTLNRPADSPLNANNRSRSFIAIPQADLLAQGLQAGDIITNILVHIKRKSNGNPYKNLTLKYFYSTNAAALFGTGYLATVPTPTGIPGTPQTIFSGDLAASAYVPVSGTDGTIDILLSTPFAWSGTANVLIIEMCYDNLGFATTGTNDEPRFTQTTSLRRYMNLKALTDFPKAGCDLIPGDIVTFNGTWAAGSNTITIVSGTPDIRPGQLSYNDGRQVVSVVGSTITMNSNSFGPGTNVAMTFANVQNTAIFYRPNLTFKFTRPYIKYPISVAGHWENNGTFEPAVSRVTLNGTIVNQKVEGSAQTTFYDLNIQNSNHVIRYTDFTVTDTLHLVSGRLKLNNGMVTLTNPATSALIRTNGYIQAETDIVSANVAPFGRIRWQMGTAPGLRIIPFINASGAPIALDYNLDAGTHDVQIGTYSTLQDNTNLPSPEVTNILGMNNAVGGGWGSAGWAMVDRYYLLDNSAGLAGQADITFRYAVGEQAQVGNTSMRAQRWIGTTDLWEFPYQPNQSFAAGSPNTVQLLDFAGFESSVWWTIVGESSPLPVSLLDFKAQQYKDKVKLMWTTASEVNSSHFEIQRTVDNDDFTYIGRAESKGPGNNLQDYVLWDNNPVEGTQYYYLHQFDFDGQMERFGPVSAAFSHDIFDIVTTTISPTDMGLTVVFNYNSTEPYSYRIMDMTGRVIVAKDRNSAVEGINVIDIDASLAKGAYHIILQNSSKVVSRKFFY